MYRIFASFLLLPIVMVPQCVTTIATTPQSELPSLSQFKELVEATRPAIVQLNYQDRSGERYSFGSGVIVSSDGYVIASCMIGAVLDNHRLTLRLADGRQVAGEARGWSQEFGVGMFKITEAGEWPFIKLSTQIQTGEICLSQGYSTGEFVSDRPETRLSAVTRVSKDAWFTTPHKRLNPHPVFNLRGELLGLSRGDHTSSYGGEMVFHLSASVIRKHWDELAAGGDLDRKRLFDEIEPALRREPLPEKMSDKTLEKIKAASVQIGDIGKKPSFSGVIVPDGYVITCAHHHRLPGTKLNVVLADGRSIIAIVLNANWLTDVSVLKILDKAELPYADLGYSSRLSLGQSLVTVGYPHNNDQKAFVLESRLIERPTGSITFHERWEDKFYSDVVDLQVAKGLSGLSGSGVFDTAGNVIGIHQSRVSARGGSVHANARVELFQKNWTALVAPTTVDEIDPDLLKRIFPSLDKLTSELSDQEQKP